MSTRDFFISFTWADVDIATAINEALHTAGFTTWFHPTDKPKGAGIADWMEIALDASTQMLALCSDAYFDRDKGYSRAERQSMFWEDPTNSEPLLILVKVAPSKFPRLIAQNEYINLTGLQRPEAAAKLVAELQSEQARIARVKAQEVDRSRAQSAFFNVQGGTNPMFTGRDTELSLLHDRVKSGTATAITAVQGMGGIGKTSLAREYAHRFGTAARFGGVWWIDAETPSGILAGYDQLAERLGGIVPRDADQEKTGSAVRDWLAQQPDSAPWLIVFDNAPDAKSVAQWLPKGSAKVIITSRYDGFDTVAELLSLDFWDKQTTAKFLQLRTGRGSDAEALSLADRLDGLPLAAEQAGAYLRENATLSFQAYEERLIQMLARAPAVLPGGYDKSLYATFRAALDAIAERPNGEAALAMLRLCAFLSPDGVELDILKACAIQTDILPEPLQATLTDELQCAEAVAALTAYSLIRLGGRPDRGKTVILHRLLGDIARDLMDEEVHIQCSNAAINMIRQLMPKNVTTDPDVWPLYSLLSPHAQALQSLEPKPGVAGKALAYVLNQSALYLDVRGDLDGAIKLLRRRVEIGNIVHEDEPKQLAIALDNLAGRLGMQEATQDEAEETFKQALELKESVLSANDPSIAITLSNLGGLHNRRKKFASAIELTKRAAEIDKAAVGEYSMFYSTDLNNLSAIYNAWAQDTGDERLYVKERETQEESTRIIRAIYGMRVPSMTVRLNNLAIMHFFSNDVPKAADQMALGVAIQLSLDQLRHPDTMVQISQLIHLWESSNQSEKANRLKQGDASDLVPIVEQIEAEHREWVAEDPDNRKFGPRSPVTGATK
ncbi:MAG: TIR domain-containing protein [Sulfitobacter sp.]